MQIVYGDFNLGIKDARRHYVFSYRWGLEGLFVSGRQWLYRAALPTFWRATTDNDRGSGFSLDSAQWMGADLFIRLKDVSATVDGTLLFFDELIGPRNSELLSSPLCEAAEAQVRYVYETATRPQAEVEILYTARPGVLEVRFEYRGVAGLAELPVCGLRFVMPTLATSYEWEGLSGETYPDRMKGAEHGTFRAEGLPVTPYIVPQECGMHLQTDRLSINTAADTTGKGSSRLEIRKVAEPFNFSLLPYTAVELESATHQEELPLPRRSVLVIAAAVRGVGGINSWGALPEMQYRLDSSKTYRTAFAIC